MKDIDNFEVVLTTKAKAKNGNSQVLIETAVMGLLYRSEVYMDNHLVDAVEVNCSDISGVDKHEEIFHARYLASHSKLEEQYTQEKIYTQVLNTDGNYIDGDGTVSVITTISDQSYKVEVFLDSNLIDIEQDEIDGDVKVFKAKYTQAHKDFVNKYIIVPKFPANTFINPVIKKFPMYKTSPMYALVFFLMTVVLVIWIVSLIVCGKAMKKLVAGVAGKEAGMIVKDLQKSMCIKGGGDADANVIKLDKDGNVISTKNKVPDFVLLPESINFKNTNQIYPVYIKNNKFVDSLILLREIVIFDFDTSLVNSNMVISTITKGAQHIKAGEVGLFEFKLENSFLQIKGLEERSYHGSIILDSTDLETRKVSPLTIEFDFILKLDEPTETKK